MVHTPDVERDRHEGVQDNEVGEKIKEAENAGVRAVRAVQVCREALECVCDSCVVSNKNGARKKKKTKKKKKKKKIINIFLPRRRYPRTKH